MLNKKTMGNPMARITLEPLSDIDGFVCAALVDSESGLSLATAGAGIAFDVMLIMFIPVIILELLVSEKVYIALDNFDTLLWKLLKY